MQNTTRTRWIGPVLFGLYVAFFSRLLEDYADEWLWRPAMRYRSRRDMLEISFDPAFAGAHEFKVAAMRKTIAFPIDPWIQLGDPRLMLWLLFALTGCGLSWREALRGSNSGYSPSTASG